MKIVIDIPEKIYYYVNTQWRDIPKIDSPISIMCNAIIDGTPLPKGHGRIADIDKVLEEMRATRTYDIPFALERVKPIVEADKGE